MLTIDQIIVYLEREIAQGQLTGQREELRQLQCCAGMLMRVAHGIDDPERVRRFHLLAAQAANAQDDG